MADKCKNIQSVIQFAYMNAKRTSVPLDQLGFRQLDLIEVLSGRLYQQACWCDPGGLEAIINIDFPARAIIVSDEAYALKRWHTQTNVWIWEVEVKTLDGVEGWVEISHIKKVSR